MYAKVYPSKKLDFAKPCYFLGFGQHSRTFLVLWKHCRRLGLVRDVRPSTSGTDRSSVPRSTHKVFQRPHLEVEASIQTPLASTPSQAPLSTSSESATDDASPEPAVASERTEQAVDDSVETAGSDELTYEQPCLDKVDTANIVPKRRRTTRPSSYRAQTRSRRTIRPISCLQRLFSTATTLPPLSREDAQLSCDACTKEIEN